MKNALLFSVITVLVSGMVFFSGCKTTDEVLEAFSIPATSGYSKLMKTLDPDDTGVTSMTLFFSIKNGTKVDGTITGWSFKVKHDIVTLVEVNNNNYRNYNLVISGDMNIASESAKDIYVGTPMPFIENSMTSDILSFDPHIPTSLQVEITISDADGNVHTVTAEGSYTYETGVINESKYNIIGNWAITRTVDGDVKEQQRIVFTGTKTSGSYTIYEGDGKVFENGSYTVSNYKDLYFKSTENTQYWGKFDDENTMSGSLNIPKDNKNDPKTGTFTGTRM